MRKKVRMSRILLKILRISRFRISAGSNIDCQRCFVDKGVYHFILKRLLLN